MVLGAPVAADGKPGQALRRRVSCALDLLRRWPQAPVLACGGVPPGAVSQRPEATLIAELLMADGVAAERILVEPTSRNTWENAARGARLICTHRQALGPPHGPPRPPVLIVTDPWHLPRAMLAFRAHGVRAGSAGCRMPATERPVVFGRMLLHELIGIGFYLLRWAAMALRGERPRRRA